MVEVLETGPGSTRGRGRLVTALGWLLAGALVVGGTFLVVELRAEESPEPGSDARLREFLAPWYDALRDQEREPARVVVVGDSISEGAGMPPPVHENRMVGMLQAQLRERMGADPGAAGFIPAYIADVLTVDDTRRSGAAPQEYMFEKWGLGGRALFMPHTSTLTYPALPARRVRVWYGAIDFLGGQGKVLVDGVDVTALGTLSDGSRSGATIDASARDSRAGLWWESADLGAGEHEVEVTSVAPDTVFVHTGVEFLAPDAGSGIHVYDGSHSGATAQHYTTEQMAAGHWTEVAALDPQLVMINLGTNPDPDYRANLELVVDRALESAPRAQVVIVDGYEPGNWTSEGWDEVRRARQEVAALNPDRVAVLDLAAHWPPLAKDGSTSEGLMIEDASPLHPNLAGNRRMAAVYAELLTPSD